MRKWLIGIVCLALVCATPVATADVVGDEEMFLTGFVADATMNAILFEWSDGNRYVFRRNDDTDLSGLEDGLSIGACIVVTYTGEIDFDTGDTSDTRLLAVADGVPEMGLARMFKSDGDEEIQLQRYVAQGFSLWYDCDLFRVTERDDGFLLEPRDDTAGARLTACRRSDPVDSVDDALASEVARLVSQGYESTAEGTIEFDDGLLAPYCSLRSGNGSRLDLIVYESLLGDCWTIDIESAAEADGPVDRLWDAIHSMSALEADGLAPAMLYGPDADFNLLLSDLGYVVGTPQGLMDALFSTGALPEGVTVRRFSIAGDSAALDLSSNFGALMSNTGTSGEYLYMGAVVNTFLTWYGVSEISVTAAGDVIETGHAIYDEPLAFYADNT